MFHEQSATCVKHVRRGLSEVMGSSKTASVGVEKLLTVEDKKRHKVYSCFCGKPAELLFRREDAKG